MSNPLRVAMSGPLVPEREARIRPRSLAHHARVGITRGSA